MPNPNTKVALIKQFTDEAIKENPTAFARVRRLIMTLISLWFFAFIIENFVSILFGVFTFKAGFMMMFYMFMIFALALAVYDMGINIAGIIPVLNSFVTFYQFGQLVSQVGIENSFNIITAPLLFSAVLQALIGVTLLVHPGIKSYCRIIRAVNYQVKQELRRQKEEGSGS